MRRAFLMAAVSAVAIWSASAYAQRSGPTLTAVSQVAGQWKGVATPGNVALSLDVDETGVCTVSSSSGSDKGTARVEGGFLIVRFTTGRGEARLEFVDRQLQGVMVIQTRSSSVTFKRA
jgi:hypothetical protein